jgi:predicted Zn-dependent protease with MMP-like domain
VNYMEHEEFEKLVVEAVGDLPKEIRQKMENVAITVNETPSQEQLRKTGVRRGEFLLGLYEGIPQSAWGKGFGGNLPDKITIFQKSILNFAATAIEIKNMVKEVVWHEIAHHFGFNEKEVRKLEDKWKMR